MRRSIESLLRTTLTVQLTRRFNHNQPVEISPSLFVTQKRRRRQAVDATYLLAIMVAVNRFDKI